MFTALPFPGETPAPLLGPKGESLYIKVPGDPQAATPAFPDNNGGVPIPPRVTQSLLEAFIQAVSEDERLGMRKESGQGSVKESPGSAHRQVQVDTHISDLCPPSVIEIHSCHSHTLL